MTPDSLQSLLALAIGFAVAGLQGEGRHGADVCSETRGQTGLDPVEQLSQPKQVDPVPPSLVSPVVQRHAA